VNKATALDVYSTLDGTDGVQASLTSTVVDGAKDYRVTAALTADMATDEVTALLGEVGQAGALSSGATLLFR
jgi:hypothetical protein